MEKKVSIPKGMHNNLIFGLLEVFIVEIKILCWLSSYEHVLESFKQKWNIFLSNKSYKIVQGNKRKVEGQFEYKMTL